MSDLTSGPGATLRPRYGRIATFGAAVLVTGTAVLGGIGLLPTGSAPSYAAARTGAAPAREDVAVLSAAEGPVTGQPTPEAVDAVTGPRAPEVPPDSGEGRRVVFDQGTQRIWLVERDGTVERSYLVSGSVSDNLEPGTYSVYSRDIDAWGIDGSELHFMVRFTTGANAPIGFHNIPKLDGERVQTRDELGTALSHGCIRQKRPDAKALWAFAPLGTTVVVVDSTAATLSAEAADSAGAQSDVG